MYYNEYSIVQHNRLFCYNIIIVICAHPLTNCPLKWNHGN